MSAKPNPTILDLDHEQARRLLMQPESYCKVPLPEYYDFTNVLCEAADLVDEYQSMFVHQGDLKRSKNGNPIPEGYRSDSCAIKHVYDGVNYRVLENKDGLLSWRPLELINPLIYSSVVYKMTECENWRIVQERFAEFRRNKNVECCSIPTGLFTHAQKRSILNWWESFEQRSVALSLEFPYMGKTDISDCYGSIYTHSISWALHGKEVAKNSAASNGSEGLLGDYIDREIQNMHSRQTIGIPQGSVLSDLIAEMVLGYADLLLLKALESDSVLEDCEYKVLRYRDDYRVFATRQEVVHSILLVIMKVLSGLNFKLGAAKTSISEDVVLDSVKEDKIAWLLRGDDQVDVHKRLLALTRFSRDYPQSGTIVRELHKISNDLDSTKSFAGRRDVLIAQVVDLMVHNPRCYPIGARLLSQLLAEEDVSAQRNYLSKIVNRCRMVPNSGLFEIWLQRIARVLDVELEYVEPLSRSVEDFVAGRRGNVNPWPWQWVKDPLRQQAESFSVVDPYKLSLMSPIISSDEAADLSSYLYKGV